ncbi:TadE/TadG family type IV pilus assembly protein [Virgibacillus ndiopensis]|uniref:TadE/TadG family type IV pilus assembly protein n=1 Tax=Virgibacillus ndiopensis TaxID=2004408 RepID=UPI001145807E|nr:TadE family protein [Virgibacillus ndiopensis]
MKFFKKIRKKEDGNFTIEATVIFPIILMLTISLVFFSLVIYQKAVLHYSANTLAERLAFVWDNSDKDIDTGYFDKYTTFSGGDGLYWRLFGNSFLSKFGLDFGSNNATIPIGGGGGSLVEDKLARSTTSILPAGATGKVSYKNSIVGGKIVVDLESPLNLPSFLQDLFGIDKIEAKVSHAVVEPTEVIRTTDTVIHAGKTIMGYTDFFTKFINKFGKKGGR